LISLDELLEGGGEGLRERHEGFMRLPIERAWVRERDDEIEDEDDDRHPEPDPELEDSAAPLALLATDPTTPPEIARAATCWLDGSFRGPTKTSG
jgi:hypothetical protein